jgi:ABC-type Fe3+-siderophore transport system permease subunit
MAHQSNDLRERLLVALPQPENLANYREVTAGLLAKHARALRWDRFTGIMFVFLAVALTFLWNHGPWRPGTLALHGLQVGSAVLFFMGVIYGVHYKIYESQIATLKEIKQVQLQILELQGSLGKNG